MKQRLTHILAASLLCSTAAPALAQEAADGMGQDTGSDYCTQLERIADEYNDRLQQEWLDQGTQLFFGFILIEAFNWIDKLLFEKAEATQ